MEASNIAESARKLVKANNLDSVIEVIQMRIEDITPDLIAANSVDVIVSEPLGLYLYNERMLETYVIARDKFLKKGGRMFPTECLFHVMPFEDMEIYYEVL